jgi:PAS domain S-box-containing protein
MFTGVFAGEDTVLVADLRGRLTWVSPSVEQLSGYQPEELLGWPVAELFPGGRDEARAVMEQLALQERVRDYRTTFPGRAGRRIAVSASLALLRDRDGAVTGTIGVVRDLTRAVPLADDRAHDVRDLLAPPTS